jgi:catechol-2,3-dioxygenase
MLDSRVVFENDLVAFLTYDEEHHRIGFLNVPGAVPSDRKSSGLEHIAFSYERLESLLSVYDELRGRGISPSRTINHGSTTSIYYKDPDGNEVELLIENFDTDEELNAFVASDAFRKTPHGRDFDPASYLERLQGGEQAQAIVQWAD